MTQQVAFFVNHNVMIIFVILKSGTAYTRERERERERERARENPFQREREREREHLSMFKYFLSSLVRNGLNYKFSS